MNTHSQNQAVNAAGSLEISADIYTMSLSEQLSQKKQTENAPKPKPQKSKPLSEIMQEAKINDCPCCQNKNALSDKPIFVEKREGQDALFLEEADVAISVTDVTMVAAQESKEDDKPSTLAELLEKVVKEDSLASFTPF